MRRRGFLGGSLAGSLAGGAAMIGLGGTGAQALPGGLRVPPEEARRAATLMQWPVSRATYPGARMLRRAQDTILRIANTIAAFEPVFLMVDAAHHGALRPRLSANVTLWDIPTDDLWCRDSGPLFASDGRGGLAVSHIRFNGWGNRFPHANDAQIAPRVAERLGLDLIPADLTGEPGGVEQDGHGLLMAHESCWVNGNRNPGLSRAEIGARLCRAYGADRILWSPGVAGLDITDYHIDALARFTGPGRVLINLPQHPDPRDPFHSAALETRDALIAAGLSVDTIPEPARPRIRRADFVATYVNYYVCNGAVIASEFGDAETDQTAAAALAQHYPGREVVLLNTDELGKLGGGIHCATQQMPAT